MERLKGLHRFITGHGLSESTALCITTARSRPILLDLLGISASVPLMLTRLVRIAVVGLL